MNKDDTVIEGTPARPIGPPANEATAREILRALGSFRRDIEILASNDDFGGTRGVVAVAVIASNLIEKLESRDFFRLRRHPTSWYVAQGVATGIKIGIRIERNRSDA